MLPTDPKFGVMPADQVVKTALTQFGIPEKHRDGLMNDMLRSIEGDFLRSYARELINLALPDRATSPLLVVVGQNEAPAAKQSVRGLVNSIQGSVGVEIANVGHVWNLQQPQLFSDLVQCWVAQRPLPPGIHALI
jgi:pimeloyl-ACP methyl ester carboxylesterase